MLAQISVLVSGVLNSIKYKRNKLRLSTFIQEEIETISAIDKPIGIAAGTVIIKCDDIGDFLLWQQVIPVLKLKAERPITFVGNATIKPLLETWFDFADSYIWINKSQWDDTNYRKSIYEKIRNVNAKTAFSPLFTRNFKMDDLMLFASNAENRISWNRKHHPYFPDLEIADQLNNVSIESKNAIELEYFRHIEFIEQIYKLGIEHTIIPLFPDFGKQNRLVIFPAANTKSRWWNYQNYADTIKKVAHKYDSILLLGGPNAIEYAKKIETAANEPKLMNLCGQTSLTDLMAFIGESRTLLCPDTSAMHFGVLTCTDTIVLSNGNNWQRFANYAPFVKSKFTVLYPPYFKPEYGKVKLLYSSKEIQTITVDRVVEQL